MLAHTIFCTILLISKLSLRGNIFLWACNVQSHGNFCFFKTGIQTAFQCRDGWPFWGIFFKSTAYLMLSYNILWLCLLSGQYMFGVEGLMSWSMDQMPPASHQRYSFYCIVDLFLSMNSLMIDQPPRVHYMMISDALPERSGERFLAIVSNHARHWSFMQEETFSWTQVFWSSAAGFGQMGG